MTCTVELAESDSTKLINDSEGAECGKHHRARAPTRGAVLQPHYPLALTRSPEAFQFEGSLRAYESDHDGRKK